MLVKVRDDVSEQSSLADSSLAHDDDGDVEPHPLGDEAHLEKVVNVYNVARLAVYPVVFVA